MLFVMEIIWLTLFSFGLLEFNWFDGIEWGLMELNGCILCLYIINNRFQISIWLGRNAVVLLNIFFDG